MSDYQLPASQLHRLPKVAPHRPRGLRSVAFGIAVLYFTQTWIAPRQDTKVMPPANAPAAAAPAADPATESAAAIDATQSRPATPPRKPSSR